ncbi:hypothetical protein GCM10009700_35160 [Brevibacterium sanguinis]
MNARYAHQIRQGIIFYELCQENLLLIEHARSVLTPLGHAAFLRLMVRDGNRPVTGMPII